MNNVKYERIIDISKAIVTGKTPSTKDEANFSDEYPFITPSDIPSYNEKYITNTERGISTKGSKSLKGYMLPKGSICVVCIGSTIGKMCYTITDCYTNQQINSIIPKDEYNSNYLFYLIRYLKGYFQLIGGGTGSGKGIVNKTTFSKVKLPIIEDRRIQDKIACILSTYDDLIEKNNRKIEILQDMAEELYKEWFVRFRFPGYKTAKFTDGIPDGWEVKRCGDISMIKAGGDAPKEYSEKKTDKYKYPIFSNGISEDGLYGYTDKPSIKKESITISARGTVGYVCLRNEPYLPIVRLLVIVPNTEIVYY